MNLKMVKDITAGDIGQDITLVGPDIVIITRKLLGVELEDSNRRFVKIRLQDEGFDDVHHAFAIPMHFDHLVGISN